MRIDMKPTQQNTQHKPIRRNSKKTVTLDVVPSIIWQIDNSSIKLFFEIDENTWTLNYRIENGTGYIIQFGSIQMPSVLV